MSKKQEKLVNLAKIVLHLLENYGQDIALKHVLELCQEAREALGKESIETVSRFYNQARDFTEGTGDNYGRGLAEIGLAWCHIVKNAQDNGALELVKAGFQASRALQAFEPHMSLAYAAVYFTLAFIHNEASEPKDALKVLGQADEALANAGDSVDLAREISRLRKQIMDQMKTRIRSNLSGEAEVEPSTAEFPPPPILQSLRRLPVLGEIPAGPFMLTEDEQNIIGNIWVDREEAAGADYALLVKGHSMQGAHINPGDYVLIREQPRADRGDIVAALVIGSGDEAALKRFDYDDTYVYLYSETKEGREVAHKMSRQEAREGLRILGKVVGIIPALGQED